MAAEKGLTQGSQLGDNVIIQVRENFDVDLGGSSGGGKERSDWILDIF